MCLHGNVAFMARSDHFPEMTVQSFASIISETAEGSSLVDLINQLKERDMIRELFAILIAAYVLAGCNTVAGAGKDIERGGEKLQNSAERNK